jgi:hypothetical protein
MMVNDLVLTQWCVHVREVGPANIRGGDAALGVETLAGRVDC